MDLMAERFWPTENTQNHPHYPLYTRVPRCIILWNLIGPGARATSRDQDKLPSEAKIQRLEVLVAEWYG